MEGFCRKEGMLFFWVLFLLGCGKCTYCTFQLHLGHRVPISIECFHCTVLVPIYRVHTPCFHNTVLVPVTGYILPVCIMQMLLLVLV